MDGSRSLTVAFLMFAGCIQPSQLACGDLICAPGSVCLPTGTCASAADIAACDGIANDAPCTTSLFTGSCISGACSPAVCGDGVVEGTEECDGSVTGVDCVDYGYDLGVPTCNARCDLDVINSCTRFGWERILSQAVNDAWTDGHRLAVTTANTEGVTLYLDGQLVASNAVGNYVAGNSARVVAWDSEGLVESTGGAFVVAVLPDSPNDLDQVEPSPDDSVYALFDSCQTFRRPPGGGAWQEIRAAGALNCALVRAIGTTIYLSIENADGTASVVTWSGQGETWTAAFTAPSSVVDVRADASGTLWAATYDSGFGPVVGTTIQSLTAGGADDVAPIGGVVYASYGDSNIARVEGGRIETLELPVEGEVLFDPDGNLYAAGDGVYRYFGEEYTDRAGVTNGVTDIAMLSDGTCAIASGDELLLPDTNSNWNTYEADSLNLDIAAVAGKSATQVVITDGMIFQQWDGTKFNTISAPAIAMTTDLWLASTGNLYAVGTAGQSAMRSGSTWQALAAPAGTTGCDLAAISGSATTIIAVGACSTNTIGTVWQLAGTTWTEIYRGGGPLAGVTLTTDGQIFASGTAGGARYDGTAWTAVPLAVGPSISSTTSSDVWVAGGPDGVIHWDGTAWSRLNVTGASNPFVAATPRAVYIGGALQSVLAR